MKHAKMKALLIRWGHLKPGKPSLEPSTLIDIDPTIKHAEGGKTAASLDAIHQRHQLAQFLRSSLRDRLII
ncbi:MAG: hypothetical protein ACJAVR_003483 [Paracoccaceae bacterium]|jgi:hypothetical protein